jgi:F-type H+-transporting ATPase subunit delta
MRSGSVRSRDALLETLDQTLEGGADAETLGRDLFHLVGLLDREPSLRRVLTEPSFSADARRSIAKSVLEGKVSDAAVSVVEEAVSQRWSRTSDIVEALEWCAVTTEASRADQAGELNDLEDELFRFGRILESSPELRDALSDRAAPLEARRRLLSGLLEGRVGSVTVDLLQELIGGRQRSLAAGLEHYGQIAAARRHRMVATAWTAAPLTDDQRERITQLLATHYSHEVHLNVIVDPAVLGGVRIAVGDDVIDSTIQTRLAQAERLLFR